MPDKRRRMSRIAITRAAYAAIAATLGLGTVAVEPERAQDGSVHIRLDPGVLANLKALRGLGRKPPKRPTNWPQSKTRRPDQTALRWAALYRATGRVRVTLDRRRSSTGSPGGSRGLFGPERCGKS